MKAVMIALVLIIAAMQVSFAQQTTDPKAWAEQFLGVLVERGAREANQFLRENSYLGQQKPETVIGQTESMQYYFEMHGDALGYELLKEIKLGSSVLLLTYVVKHENHFVLWNLDFYNPKTGWNLQHFGAEDSPGKIPRF